MARATDFDFGHNLPNAHAAASASGSIADELTGCMGSMVCPKCGRFHGYCSEVNAQLTGTTEGPQLRNGESNMDLSGHVSGKKREKFEEREWITSDDLPKKGSSKWKIDGARDAKKNKTGILVYVDLSRGKLKRVMSLRKNFTLDMFVEELGTNSAKWTGKFISLERGGDEGQYVNVAS